MLIIKVATVIIMTTLKLIRDQVDRKRKRHRDHAEDEDEVINISYEKPNKSWIHHRRHRGLEQLFKSNVIPEKLGVSCFDNKGDINYYDDNIEVGPSNHDQIDKKRKRHRESEDDSSSEDEVNINFTYQPSNEQSDSIETNELCIEVAKILSPRKKVKSEDVYPGIGNIDMQIERSTSSLQQNKYWVSPLHHNCVVPHFDSEHNKKPLPPNADDNFYNTK